MNDWLHNSLLSVLVAISALFGGGSVPPADINLGAAPVFTTAQGGTGTTSPSGILYGDESIRLKTVVIGSGLSFSGGTLSATGGASSTLLADSNIFSGNNTFSNTITGSVTGNAGTATALAANGANCSSGNSPLGVNASGVVENCFDVWTEAENTSAAYISDGNTNWDNSYGFTTFAYPFPSDATSTALTFSGGLTTSLVTLSNTGSIKQDFGSGANPFILGTTTNTFIGNNLNPNTAFSGADNVYVGNDVGSAVVTKNRNTFIGSKSNNNPVGSGADDQTALGYNALAVSRGNGNIAIGANSAASLSSGTFNIGIGAGINFASNTASQQLNIGNLLFGTGVYNSTTSSATAVTGGAIGVGTTTPGATFGVQGDALVSGNFNVANITATGTVTAAYASTTGFSTAYASSTLYYGAGLASCSGGNFLTWTSGQFGCAADTTGASFAYPFPSNSTTTLIDFQGGLKSASTTLTGPFIFANATGTNATTTAFFSTTASSTNLFSNSATFNAATVGTLTLGNALTVANGGSGSTTLGGLLAGGGTSVYSVATSTATISSPLSGTLTVLGSGQSISIANAAADGSTKGAASFTAADFDASSGNISIDYTNGQAASASLKGFLTSTDWTTFNNKIDWGAATSTSANQFVYTNNAGKFVSAASSSFFGYTPLNPTRQLTVAGTANQITSSAGAQDLSADRTWTLSLPTDFRVASVTISGNALLANATTTSLGVKDLLNCDTIDTDGSGNLKCGSDSSGGGGVWPFTTSDTNYGVAVQSTTTPEWFKNGLHASSTSYFSNSSTTLASVLSTLWVGTGGANDSEIEFGPASNEWDIGYDATDKTFAISSSTTLGTNNALTIDKNLKLTFGNASSSVLTVSGTASTTNLVVSGVRSALALMGADGTMSAYSGIDCTNQFVRDVSATGGGTCATVGAADVSLANLTATDSTLTFSGTYNGSTARTIGLNLGNANTWTALQTFANATSTLLSSTYASTTDQVVGNNFTFGGVTGTTWAAFCTAITGGAGLCDGADATGAGGGEWPFTPSTYAGVANQSTTTPFWLNGTQLIASSSLVVNATTTNATTTSLNVSGQADFDGLTSALIVTGAGGILAEYAGTSCTNQFVRSLDALGAATCASINNGDWSGTDLSVANGGTGLSTFGGSNTVLYTTAADTLASEAAFTYNATTDVLTTVAASTTNLTVATWLKIPAVAAFTSTIAGAMGIDTTQNQLIIGVGTAARVYATDEKWMRVPHASTTQGAATTTKYLGPAPYALTLTTVQCDFNNFIGVSIYDGTNRANYFVASSTIGTTTLTTNTSFNMGEAMRVDYGTSTNIGTDVRGGCTFKYRINST